MAPPNQLAGMARERDEAGRFAAGPNAEDVLDVMEPGETYRSGELAEKLDASRRHLTNLMRELDEAGRVEKIEVHPRLHIWRLPEDPDA